MAILDAVIPVLILGVFLWILGILRHFFLLFFSSSYKMKHEQLKLNNKKIDVIYDKLEKIKTEDEFEDLILNQVEFSLQSDDAFKSKFLGLLFHVVNGGRIGRFKWLLYDINNRVQKDKYFPFYYEVVDDYYLNENKFKTEADTEEQIEKDFVAFVNERMQKVKSKLSK